MQTPLISPTREPSPDTAAPQSAASLPATAAAAKKSPRVVFVDLLRLLAALQMINGHTLAAVLDPSIQSGPIFDRYNAMRGMVSIAFLLSSGMAYHLSTLHRLDDHLSNPTRSRRRIRIAIDVILVGYFLSFPWGAFSSDPALREAAWFYLQRIGILQCIGFGLLALEGMTLLLKRRAAVLWACAILASMAIVVAPWCDTLIQDGRPHWLLNWLSTQGGSLFPIVPYTGFMFGGVLIGGYILPAAGSTPFWIKVRRTAVAALVIAAIWQLAERSSFSLHDPAIHQASTAPALSLRNTAWVMGLLLFLVALSHRVHRLPRLLTILSSETLFIFAFHILALFLPRIGITQFLGNDLSLPQALLVSLFMLVLTCGATVVWHHWKIRRRVAKVRAGRS